MSKQEDEKELWESCQFRMNDEGFHYCFTGYSNWEDIKDEHFHKLRKDYVEAAKLLKEYIDKKASE